MSRHSSRRHPPPPQQPIRPSNLRQTFVPEEQALNSHVDRERREGRSEKGKGAAQPTSLSNAPPLSSVPGITGLGTFRWQEGRRLLEHSSYILPHDPTEMHRSDLMHSLFRELTGSNYLAPITHPQTILDVGCGTGQWVREMGHAFPQARLIGVDLLSDGFGMEIGHPKWPANASLCPGDILQGLPYPDASFEYIHQRHLWSIPSGHWAPVIRELYRITRPGGWCEVIEGDGIILNNFSSTTTASSILSTWSRGLFHLRGVNLDDAARIGDVMRQVGFVDVQRRDVRFPMGHWAGELGQAVWAAHRAFLEGCRMWEKALNASPSHTLSPAVWDGWLRLFDEEMAQHKDIGQRTFVFYGRRPL